MNFTDVTVTKIQNKNISKRLLAAHQAKVTNEVETFTEKSVSCFLDELFRFNMPNVDLIHESLIPDSDFSLIKNYNM